MIKLKDLLNEKLYNSQGEGYTFGKGDIVKDINPDCPHHGAEGEVTKGGKVKITFKVTNNGKNYKEGDELEKTVDQMVKLKSDELNEGIGSLQLKTFKIFIKGYKKPFRVAALDKRDAKKVAHQMMRNNTVKITRIVKEGISEKFTIRPPAFSSREAKNVVDGALKQYSKDLKKLQYRVIVIGSS